MKPSEGSGGGGGDDPDDAPLEKDQVKACDKLELIASPKSPEILIVLDRSGSMIGGGGPQGGQSVDRWTPSANAVKALTSDLTSTVKFGLMLFPAPSSQPPRMQPEVDDILDDIFGGGGGGGRGPMFDPSASCTPGKVDVPIALESAAQIAQTLDARESYPLLGGSTPTATSLSGALGFLNTPNCPDCESHPKYVLLVTDGQPTCAMGSPGDPDIAATIAAIDQLKAAEISTYVVGYGLEENLASTMNEFAMHGGTEKYLPVEDEQTLLAELKRITGALVPCEYELEKPIEKPEFVRVQIDGETYLYGTDWEVVDNKIVLHPDAGACTRLRDARVHDLKIVKECEVVELI